MAMSVTTFSYGYTGTVISAVPEPSTWLMMIVGVALVGIALRINRARAASLSGLQQSQTA
jgi:hypothetical protein